MDVILLMAAVFALCFLADKGYTKLFKSKQQHRSGMAVRQNKRYGSMGFVLVAIGVAALVAHAGNKAVLIGGIILVVLGIGLTVYYLSSGIYYDEDGFLVEALGKKGVTYSYRDIVHQQLYTVQGGSAIIELHMADGSAVQVVSTMPEYDKFLNYAFLRWCAQKGLDPENCPFHDISVGCWFPEREEA